VSKSIVTAGKNARGEHHCYAVEFEWMAQVQKAKLGWTGSWTNKVVSLPRKVTRMVDDEEVVVSEEEHAHDSSHAIHYSLDIETKNYKLSYAERMALRRMMQLMIGEVSAKLQFVLDDPLNAIAKAHISSSGAGRSELPPLREED
jgi:hypothetical protein